MKLVWWIIFSFTVDNVTLKGKERKCFFFFLKAGLDFNFVLNIPVPVSDKLKNYIKTRK